MTQILLSIIFFVLIIGVFLFFKKRAFQDAHKKKEEELKDIVERLKGSFATLSLEALSKNSEEFLKLAHQKLEASTSLGEKDLEGKKKLIDQTFCEMKLELKNVENLVKELESDRIDKFAKLSTNVEMMREETRRLQQTTDHLKTALVSTKSRGQWGERMAEDVLRLAGFIEGINYAKQKAQGAGRPDYTFMLPQGLKVNMDVKFPLDNYIRFYEAKSEIERDNYKAQFLRDVRDRIKEVTSRDYIDPEHNTVDYVIVFIPNEQVYAFINENDRLLLDEAMKRKVIFCSPLTLYAILAVIRQALDNFNLERTAHKILLVLGAFEKQYQAFCLSLERMGERIDAAKKEYEELVTTRKNQLDRQLKKVEELRTEKGLDLSESQGTVLEDKRLKADD